MKKYLTAKEIAGLPGLPGTSRGVHLRAVREGWGVDLRRVRGGLQKLFLVADLPAPARHELRRREDPRVEIMDIRRQIGALQRRLYELLGRDPERRREEWRR